MDQIDFNIIYENQTDNSITAAVENVFKNYTFFLKYNNFYFDSAIIKIGPSPSNHFQLSELFSKLLVEENFNHYYWFKDQPLIMEAGNPDYIGTCFYMINCLQEYDIKELDFLGRFDFKNSYQHRFSCADKNLVLDYFQEISLVLFGKKIPLKKSTYHLSHDIDFLNSAWKDEIKKSLKTFKFSETFATIKQKNKGKDSWQNLEQILKIETQKNVKSTFFWLVNSGETPFKNIANADYQITDSYVLKCRKLICESELHDEGLHKSISKQKISEELKKIGDLKLLRYHYLKFNIREDFPELEASPIEADFSLGFSRMIGFRNSYGLPFSPFNPITKEQYTFLEYPLHIMDSALYYFMNCKTPEAMYLKTEKFIKNNKYSCHLGILWHNNFFEEKFYPKLMDLIQSELD